MKYETINWDDGWDELVAPLVKAHESQSNEEDRHEAIYDRRYVESASCKLYAERLLANLKVKYGRYEFAAHTDATGYPPNSYWRILARTPNGRPLPNAELTRLRIGARAILRAIEKKYPSVGEWFQKKKIENASSQSKAQAATHGMAVKFADEKPGPGCLLKMLGILCLATVVFIATLDNNTEQSTIAQSVSPPVNSSWAPVPTANNAVVIPPGGETTIEFEVIFSSTKFASIRGRTNLPAGTQLMLSVEEVGAGGFRGSESCSVASDGTFSATGFGPDGGLKDGDYTAEIVMPYPLFQPAEVKAAIGPLGERLKGALVKEHELGRIVMTQRQFKIGGDDSSAKQLDRTTARISEWKNTLRGAESLHKRMLNAKKSNISPQRIEDWVTFQGPFLDEMGRQKDLIDEIEPLGVRVRFAVVISDIENMYFAVMFERGENEFQKWSAMYQDDRSWIKDFIRDSEKGH